MGRARKVRLSRIKIMDVLKNAVSIAEILFPKGGSGEQKKDWVIDFVNEYIDIPILNENQERVRLEILIDITVALGFNRD